MIGKRVFALLPLLCLLAACGGENPKTKTVESKKTEEVPEKTSQVVMETSKGTIKIELYDSKAPITVQNFLKYVDDKHYDGTIFHRVIPDFMIQGGGFVPGLREKGAKNPPIKNEAYNGLENFRGTLAMARTNQPDSATDQFFINTKDNNFLDRAQSRDRVGYAVFGRVIDGMDVVDAIRIVRTADVGGHEAVPVEDVIIKSIRRVTP